MQPISITRDSVDLDIYHIHFTSFAGKGTYAFSIHIDVLSDLVDEFTRDVLPDLAPGLPAPFQIDIK